MGWLTPKYPKSDTPGTSSAPAPSSRRSRRTVGGGSSPARSGMTTDQMRSLAAQPGVTVDYRGNTAKVTVDEWDAKAQITSQVYTRQSDGSWTAA